MKRLLTKKALRERIGFSFAHIDRLEAADLLPERIKIGGRVFWLESEIDTWIDAHVAKRDRSV